MLPAKQRQVLPMTRGLGFPKLQSASTLVRTRDHEVLVDSGASEGSKVLCQMLQAQGLTPDDIDIVLITHSHFDHVENWHLFKNATFYIHWRELAFIESLLACGDSDEAMTEVIEGQYVKILDYYVRAIKRRLIRNKPIYKTLVDSAQQWHQLSDAEEITPQIRMVPTPGHTAGHMSVGIASDSGQSQGKTVWICGDAITTKEAWQTRSPHVCADFDLYSSSCDEIEKNGGVALPGHDQPFDLGTLEYVSYESLNAYYE